MQDFVILDAYLGDSKKRGPLIDNLIRTLFMQCYELPEDVRQHRPSFLNFHKTMQWGGDIINGFIGMFAAMNGKHACFTAAYNFIKDSLGKDPTGVTFNTNLKVIPGFGRPLGHGKDYRCIEIELTYLESGLNKNIITLKDSVIDFLSNKQKSNVSVVPYKEMKGIIRDNLVFWNAAVAYSLGLSVHHAPLIFILASQLAYVNSLTKK